MNKNFNKSSLTIIASVIAFVLFLTTVTIFVFYTQFTGEKARRKEISVDVSEKDVGNETESRIEQLEEKLKNLEERQGNYNDNSDKSSLTKDQILAIVELWCPDDDYDNNGFISIGSGTIVSSDGIIFTNRHVISNSDWSVIQSSPTCYVGVTEDISQPAKIKYMADLLAYSPETDDFFDFDIAVLYIYDICYECPDAPPSLPEEFPYLDLGYSADLGPGDYVAIAGYPEIGAGTWNFTEGIISGRVGDFVLKTDAKIDSGNSGGSALNSQNELVGIPTWTISGQAESIGYVIEIDDVYDWFQKEVLPLFEE